jgi:phosphoglycolate phosphatase-like HAD superfamily hydrolase
MSGYDVKNSSENYNRQITAKPLSETVKISPKNSMVMFNLNGTLVRNGVLLRKILKHTSQKAVDAGFNIKTESDRTPIANHLNHITQEITQKLEEHCKNNKDTLSDTQELLAINHIALIVDSAIMPDDSEKLFDENTSKVLSKQISTHIHDALIKDTAMKLSIEKALSIYDKQTSLGSQKIITPEVTRMIENMASLGVPIAIVSNKTQEFVNQAFERIFETLPLESQKKWHDKDWHFTKIGIQRDSDGDIIQPIKPAPDLLIASHAKADKFNAKNNKEAIENVIVIGNSEAFDMRAADNLQRTPYATDNRISVYKLLCIYDDPTKKVHDDSLIRTNSAFNHIGDVNQRLTTVFKNT